MSEVKTVLVGHEAELRHVSKAIDEVAAGNGGIVLLDGEPGIGKTTLLQAAETFASARGVLVFRGCATELSRSMPFAAVMSCLPERNPLPAPAHGVLLDGPSTDPVESGREYALVEAILTVIDKACAESPVTLLLDDMHWADPSSLLVVQKLSELVKRLPLLIVAAARPTPAGQAVTKLLQHLDDHGLSRLHLPSLSGNAVETLAGRLMGGSVGPRLARTLTAAAGNPRYATALACELRETGMVTVVNGVADYASGSEPSQLPESLRRRLSDQLDFVDQDSWPVLTLAAVLGDQVEPVELATLLGASLLEVWRAVQAAHESGLLESTDGQLRFRHGVIRQTLAAQVPALTRKNVQARAARELIDAGAPAERVAGYLVTGGMNTVGPTWLIEASDHLIARVPTDAATLLGRALAAPLIEPDTRKALRILHVRALLAAGRIDDAEALARAVLSADHPDAPTTRRLQWLLMQTCLVRGHPRDALAEARKTLAMPGISEREQARHHGFAAMMLALLEDFPNADVQARTAIALGEAQSDDPALGYGHSARSLVMLAAGRPQEALEHVDRFTVAFNTDGSDEFRGRGIPALQRAYCLIELDRYSEAAEQLTAAGPRTRAGHSGATATLLARARLQLASGRWDDALTTIEHMREVPDRLGFAAAGRALADLIMLRRGGYLDESPEDTEDDSSMGTRAFATYLRAWIRGLDGERHDHPDRTLAQLLTACRRARAGLAASWIHEIWPDLARIAARAGDTSAVAEVASWAAESVARQPTHTRTGTALLCRGLAESDPDLLAEAAASYEQAGRPLYRAQAHENHAVLLAAQGRTGEARIALESAISDYGRLGADADIARAQASLRHYGIRRTHRGPRTRARSGLAALTPTEHKIADLVTKGMSNSDIATHLYLSRRTIQTHVSNILTKLGLSSRVQVVVALTNRD